MRKIEKSLVKTAKPKKCDAPEGHLLINCDFHTQKSQKLSSFLILEDVIVANFESKLEELDPSVQSDVDEFLNDAYSQGSLVMQPP